MHKIRSLARRSSGRVNAPQPTRQVSSRQEKRASNSSARKQPLSEAAPEADVGRAHSTAGNNLNALALFGKKIFGSHHHRHHHQPSVGTGGAATTPTPRRVRHGPKYPSLDLMGVYASSRRPRRGNQMNTLSGGTSLMDIQAFVHANRAKADVRLCDEGSDVFLVSNGRRASETVRGRESSASLVTLEGHGEMPLEDVEVAGPTSLRPAAGVGRCQEEDREGRSYSIESSPPTPPLPRRSFKTSAPLSPRRHQKKGSNSSLTRSTSLKVSRKIVNHKDLDLVVQRGDYARQCRRTGAPTTRSRISRRGGNTVALPPLPVCPMVPDVFAVEDTVRRNREAALESLMGRIGQGKKEVAEVVKNENIQRMTATPVGSEEDVDGEDVALATIRARTSLSELADFFLQISSAMEAIYAGESYASIKDRAENKSVHLNAPAVTGHENPSDGELCRFTSQIFGRFPLPPTAPEPPKKRSSIEVGFPFSFAPSKFKKQEKRSTLPVSEDTIRPGRPWKFKDLEKLPCIEPADRIAGVVRWVADVQEALDLDAVQDIAHTIRAPPPYVPYWHAT